jgi:hypothetical protein
MNEPFSVYRNVPFLFPFLFTVLYHGVRKELSQEREEKKLRGFSQANGEHKDEPVSEKP